MDRATGERVGILGGSFDPIHIGHLILADEARAQLDLDRVILVPARHSPLKGRETMFTADERCEMVSLAIAGNPAFALSRIDVDRDGPSFTVDTLRLFREQLGVDARIWFIMGMDSLQTFHRWRSPGEIISLARLAVLTRPGASVDLGALGDSVPGVAESADLIETLQIGISSTTIRRRIEQGLSYCYMLPALVAQFIADHPRPVDALR